MFVSSEHLPQRLRPEHYTSDDVHQREVQSLFMPGWHCIAAASQLSRVGDFRTIEILGRPLICWHTSTGFRTYLNICSHRFSTLTDQRQGHAVDRLKCQYHGWEYDETGNTCKIPDAQCFRPLVKGELGLREYPTQTIGQLIFICLEPEPTPLREYLGDELVSMCLDWFGPHARIIHTVEQELLCNWKIAIENVIESYHIEMVHAKSFSRWPKPEECTHQFHPHFDHFIHDYTGAASKWGTWNERLIAWMAGSPAELRYHNLLRYPNIIIGKGGQVSYLQMYWPVAPNRTRNMSIFFDLPGPRGRLFSELAHRLITLFGTGFIRQIISEDAGIYPSIHRGNASPDRPYGGGIISAREERIFAFQDRILACLNGSSVATPGRVP